MKAEYKLVSAQSPEEMERKVNEAVGEGYDLHMGVVIVPSMYKPPMILQWVVRAVDEVESVELEMVNGKHVSSAWLPVGFVTP